MTRLANAATLALILALSGLWPAATGAEDNSLARDWLEGSAFAKQMQSSGSVLWNDGMLGAQLQEFAEDHRICIWLDRRVDPSQRINANLGSMPLDQLLQAIVAPLRLGVCVVGSVVYIGPEAVVDRLFATVAWQRDQLRRLPDGPRSALLSVSSAEWEKLTTPREALQQIANGQRLAWRDLSGVPHDLLPARKLPRLTVHEQLSLLLAGFDLSYRWDQALVLAPLRSAKPVTRTYAVSGPKLAVFDRIVKLYPQASVATAENRKRVSGSEAMHDQLQRALRNAGKAPPRGARQVYSLKVARQPLDGVARQLAQRFRWTLAVDDAVDRTTPVEFSVKNASLDELLMALADAANIKITLTDQTLRMAPK